MAPAHMEQGSVEAYKMAPLFGKKAVTSFLLPCGSYLDSRTVKRLACLTHATELGMERGIIRGYHAILGSEKNRPRNWVGQQTPAE